MQNKNKICSVFGHSEIDVNEEFESKLYKVFENIILNGFDTFYFGGLGEFDNLCYSLISRLKNKYNSIKRVYCCLDPRHLKISKRPRWLGEYEEFIYLNLDFEWWYTRVYYRNCAMIDRSDLIIFHVEKRENSGAYKAYKYAVKKKKQIINTFELI